MILIGNVTRDAELRHTQNGNPVSILRLTTNHVIKGQEENQFHCIVCWDWLGETTAAYAKKGDPLHIDGRPRYRAFLVVEGKERGEWREDPAG